MLSLNFLPWQKKFGGEKRFLQLNSVVSYLSSIEKWPLSTKIAKNPWKCVYIIVNVV